MTEPEVFVLADRALAGVVAQIDDAQWSMSMPADFATSATEQVPTLREIISQHAYDDAWVPDMLAGRTMDEVGTTAFKGELLGDDPRGSFDRIVGKAVAAAQALDDLERTVHCSFGDFTAREYLWQANFFRGLRAHDIARVIGIEPALPTALVEGLWEELSPVAEQWRAIGVFGPAVEVPADAPLLDRVLGLTGRQPQPAG